ncbi:hypothetical protein NE865_02252 [Phthorimaea operculella]|nr:hypothetical protein NE865_02252 [Phthorimaea operculella]
MFSKYHRNAIITGYIDSYCLVCESHLRSEDDINGHISKPIHSKNLDATAYLEKHKDDCVRKVKKGYFCEFCNVLLTTAAKVGLHVIEEKHISNKGAQLLRRIGNSIAFQDILLNEKAWNGLIDDTCAVCNTEFDNELLHKTETTHILNLVQNNVEFANDTSIYRRIDDSSFQCLTCNLVVGLNTIKTHFQETEHLKLYQQCVQAAIDLNANGKPVKPSEQVPKATPEVTVPKATSQVTVPKVTPQVTIPKAEKSTPITPEVKKSAPFAFNFNFSSKQPETKSEKPKTEIPVTKQDTDSKKPITLIDNTKKTETATESKNPERPNLLTGTVDLDEQICKALNAKDYITHDENGKKWCLLCDWTMDTVVIYNHVNGRHHQMMLKLHKERLQKRTEAQQHTEKTKVEKVEELTPQEKQEQENKSKILDSVLHYQQNDVNVDFLSNKAMCKKCSTILDFNCRAIEAHIEHHKKILPAKTEVAKPAKVDEKKTENTQKIEVKNTQPPKPTKAQEVSKPVESKTVQKVEDKRPQRVEEETCSRASSVASNKETEEEIEKFAKANDLAYGRRGGKVYCRVCDTRIPASTKNMKEHISGQHHKNRLAKFSIGQHVKAPSIVKRPMIDFIKLLVLVENGFVKDVIINERYCINIMSFSMITCVNRLKCEPCDVNLSVAQLEDHKESISHMKAMCETDILTSMESEFIREVRPEVLHCGYCNTICSDEDLQQHLDSTAHREARASAGWRLHQGLAELMCNQMPRERFDMVKLLMAVDVS